MLKLVRSRIRDERVVDAMAAVPREPFVPRAFRHQAYADQALPIGNGQTISQPLMIALMLEAVSLSPEDRVLEVGTGSGYEAALLGQIASDVVSVELVPALAERARATLGSLGAANVHVYDAGVTLGYADDAPYDAIVVAAGAPHIPRSLIDQLARAGRMVVPVGPARRQQLMLVRNTMHGIELSSRGACAFVPLIGRDAWPA
ncbi:MAG: protein-L-isoaspartate(D-aspartate) O-methyltransferase [Chloroflexi bacterium]|nr:protein-L-isoaspartate(D-aspartate) O-methyltransferase [Chloroflexota bacterium]